MTLRAIVIGTGWAGEGHTLAMQNAGVEVVALCGRTLEATQKRAAQLGIKEICFDWRAALEEFLPDIVSIATPGGPHCEMALAAAGLGCHVFCEKPLAINVEQARMMLQAVERARVKHAYGSTSRYGPGVEFARSLVSSGSIGQIHEIECIFRVFPPPSVLSQYTWVNDLDQGGGVFNNGYTHMLGQMLYMTGAKVLTAAGETHTLDDRLPVGTPIHDFREGKLVDPAKAHEYEWRKITGDQSLTILLQLQMPEGNTAHARTYVSWKAANPHPNHCAIHGSKGTLHMDYSLVTAFETVKRYDAEQKQWEELAIPEEILAKTPLIKDGLRRVQQDWDNLAKDFVADINGEGYRGYPTFYDGWVACEIGAIVRSGRSWATIPDLPVSLGKKPGMTRLLSNRSGGNRLK